MNIKLREEEHKLLVDFLLEYLHTWSENGVEGKEEKDFQSLVNITCKLREALGEKSILLI